MSEQASTASSSMAAPPGISAADMEAFHSAHFGATSTSHFAATFLQPETETASIENEACDEDAYVNEPYEYYEEEDDKLVYYADGTKRTLTDEQIAMFRHSEIESILRERRHAAERGTSASTPQTQPTPSSVTESRRTSVSETMLDDGELAEGPSTEKGYGNGNGNGNSKQKQSKKQNKKQKQKAKQKAAQREVKPDLRKRTWDKVEQGVGSLDYGEEVIDNGGGRRAPAGRRTISYDDI